MPKCPRCQKEVYFDSPKRPKRSLSVVLLAEHHESYNLNSCGKCKTLGYAEKVTSLGKDWHRPCLKCEKCKKTLNAGGHAEHEGKPYCNYPCYAALFGPKGFGRGGAESYTFN